MLGRWLNVSRDVRHSHHCAGVVRRAIAFIAGYEHRLKELNPTVRNLRYDTKDLMNYIDNLPDLGILT